MGIKIVLDKDNNSIRKMTDADKDLADLRVFVPITDDYTYLAKFDYQLVPLIETAEKNVRYKLLKLSSVHNAFDATQIRLVGISADCTSIFTTNSEEIETTREVYSTENTVLSSAVINADIVNMYEKIVRMTELNIEIHDKIMGKEETTNE